MTKKILMSMFALLAFATTNAQTSYSMVIQKTDGTETVIPTKDIVQITFRASDDNNNSGSSIDSSVVGTWVMDDLGGRYSCGWKFNADGTCVFGEWSYKGTPKFNETYKVPWSTSGNTLYITAGPESASFIYSVSSDGKTLTLTATSSGDDYSEMAGTYTKL